MEGDSKDDELLWMMMFVDKAGAMEEDLESNEKQEGRRQKRKRTKEEADEGRKNRPLTNNRKIPLTKAAKTSNRSP